ASQLNDPSFSTTTSDFQKGIVASFSQYIMNATAETYVGAEKFSDEFNSSNKVGYILDLNTATSNPDNYFTIMYKNNKKIGTVPYIKTKNED
ncbi:MAG TPA: hypothetical protein VK616_10510, partial [Flavitalea sp.]|nr:hypothetical protein [Flavitalea sp.]